MRRNELQAYKVTEEGFKENEQVSYAWTRFADLIQFHIFREHKKKQKVNICKNMKLLRLHGIVKVILR